jgi:hypothetical protein
MVYKRRLCGVAQYIMAPVAWMWTWTARACIVSSTHKEEVSGPSKPANKFRQRIKHVKSIITQLYISKENGVHVATLFCASTMFCATSHRICGHRIRYRPGTGPLIAVSPCIYHKIYPGDIPLSPVRWARTQSRG